MPASSMELVAVVNEKMRMESIELECLKTFCVAEGTFVGAKRLDSTERIPLPKLLTFNDTPL